jgi:hypothetical protein
MGNVIADGIVDSGPGIDAFLWPRLALLRYASFPIYSALEDLEAALPADVDAIVTVANELRRDQPAANADHRPPTAVTPQASSDTTSIAYEE